MKIIRQHAFGGPEVLRLEDLTLPPLEEGEVLLRTEAAAVTFFDIMNRRGQLSEQEYYEQDALLPLSPGYQGAGHVEEVGPGVTDFQVGDRVAWAMADGAYATHVVAPAAVVVPVPEGVDLGEAAGVLIQGLLAYKITHEAHPLEPGDWVMVQAAAGGVGSLITQYAKRRGARVIGVVSSEHKVAVAKEAGADEVVLSTGDVVADVKRITGKGVAVVYDGAGRDTFDTNLDSLAPRGYLIVYGQASGFVPPFDLMRLNDKGSLFVTRFCLPHYFDEWPPKEFLAELFEQMRTGEIVVRIDGRYPLADAAAAHKAVESRESAGRVLLVP
ncbi:quinone oxidoreductase [Actinophytocola sp.]|uniref:quinone oxidoreductase family protein n=1 Tax=Actinophytocola sp. TaxID=1872138 RepID=UPI002D730A51|nr:quinone oxidoreductase [Actinophytocola sp.]HYQ63340.1 quinone oxidoreductase [Actinophytocola sp.]